MSFLLSSDLLQTLCLADVNDLPPHRGRHVSVGSEDDALGDNVNDED